MRNGYELIIKNGIIFVVMNDCEMTYEAFEACDRDELCEHFGMNLSAANIAQINARADKLVDDLADAQGIEE